MTNKKTTPDSEKKTTATTGSKGTKQPAKTTQAKATSKPTSTKSKASATTKSTTKSPAKSPAKNPAKGSANNATQGAAKASAKAKAPEEVAADTKAVEGTKNVSTSKKIGAQSAEKTEQPSPSIANKTASEPVSSQQEVQKVTQKQSGNGIAWLGVFLGLAGLAFAGYTYMNSQVATSKNEGALTRLNDFNSQTTQLRQSNDAAQAGLSELKGEVAGFGSRFDAIDSKFSDVDAKFDDVNQSISAAKQGLDEGLTSMQSNLDDMQTGIDERFNEQVTKLEDDYGRIVSATSAFQLKEAQSLVDMAQERLVLADDVDSAKRALIVADEKLAEIDDSGLLPLRQQVQQSIADLEQAETPDVADLVTRLAGAVSSINSLPLAEMGRIHPTAESVAAENEEATSTGEPSNTTNEEVAEGTAAANGAQTSQSSGEWWKSLEGVTDKVGGALGSVGSAVSESLEDVIVVHDVSETATPLMEPQQRYFLKENLKMAVQNTEYALIRGYAEAAAVSAKSAQEILSQYFVGDDEQVQSLNSLLEEAATLDLTVTIPDISATVEAVKAAANQ